ncbi:hypothetical protein [Hoylesella nanceiensis]|nr:hypothetical protein [Hoylesella nanceiensis]
MNMVGADISLGMLKISKKKWHKKTKLSLIPCPAEELHFTDHSL